MKYEVDSLAQNGNRRARRGVRTIAAAVSFTALAAAGCTTERPTSPVAETTTVTTAKTATTEMAPQAFVEKINAQSRKLAHGIIDTAGVKDPRFTVITKTNPYSAEAGSTMPQSTTEVSVKVQNLVGDADYGIYRLAIDGPLDSEGKHVDPDKAEGISITMDLRKDGDPGDISGIFYSYELINLESDNQEYHLVNRAQDKGGNDNYHFYTFDTIGSPTPANLETLTEPVFVKQSERAETILNWAAGAQPMNYAPQL